MEIRILAIDPSGTGTTGMFFKYGKEEQFSQITNPDWKKHYDFIEGMVKVYHPDILLYETTNFISLRGKDMTSLLKLLGSLETLSLACSRPRIETVPVNQVKGLRNKLLKKQQAIAGINYQPGKGWHHNGKKISTHQLDAYLVYWLWKEKEQAKPHLGKTIEVGKMKQKHKTKVIEEELPEDIDELSDLPEDEIILCSEPDDIDDFPDEPEEPEETVEEIEDHD